MNLMSCCPWNKCCWLSCKDAGIERWQNFVLFREADVVDSLAPLSGHKDTGIETGKNDDHNQNTKASSSSFYFCLSLQPFHHKVSSLISRVPSKTASQRKCFFSCMCRSIVQRHRNQRVSLDRLTITTRWRLKEEQRERYAKQKIEEEISHAIERERQGKAKKNVFPFVYVSVSWAEAPKSASVTWPSDDNNTLAAEKERERERKEGRRKRRKKERQKIAKKSMFLFVHVSVSRENIRKDTEVTSSPAQLLSLLPYSAKQRTTMSSSSWFTFHVSVEPSFLEKKLQS